MSMKPFQVYLSPRDYAVLARLAKQLGVSKAEAVREAVRRWAGDLAGSDDPILNLIGTVDDPAVPSDLSTRFDEYAVQGLPQRQVAERGPESK